MSSNEEPVSAFAIYRKKILNKSQTSKRLHNSLPKKKNKLSKFQKSSLDSSETFNKARLSNIANKTSTVKIKKNKFGHSEKTITIESNNESLSTPVVKTKRTKSLKKLKYDKSPICPTQKLVKTVKKKSGQKRKIDENEDPPILIPISSVVNQSSSNGNFNVKNKLKKSYVQTINSSDEQIESEEFSHIISNLNKTDPSPEGHNLFKWLINPLTTKEFFDKYWETNILHIERSSSNYYTHLLTTQRLDDIFREFPLYYNRNVDVVSYDNGIKEVHNEEGRVVASALYDYYLNGCSIRILNPHTYDQKVHLLISTLQEYFGTMVGTNVYLTPPGSQGFAPHYDDIEAFIVQLEGKKHWKLYKKDSDVLARYSSPNFKREELGDPFMEVTLCAGDLLYFPRGTIHEGRTDTEEHSLHITVSVYQNTSYVDLLEHIIPEALKKAANEDIAFRRGLPLNYLNHLGYVNRNSKSNVRQTVMENVKTLIKNMIDYVDVDQAADKLGRKFMYDAMPPVLSKMEVNYTSKYDGDYMKDGKIFNRVEIGLDTEVRLVRYHCLRLVIDESSKIYYNTDNAKFYHGEEEQFLEIDDSLIPCIEKLQNTYPKFIQVEKLPIKDNIGKAQLVSHLWERGLLVTNGHLPSFSCEDDSDNDSD